MLLVLSASVSIVCQVIAPCCEELVKLATSACNEMGQLYIAVSHTTATIARCSKGKDEHEYTIRPETAADPGGGSVSFWNKRRSGQNRRQRQSHDRYRCARLSCRAYSNPGR